MAVADHPVFELSQITSGVKTAKLEGPKPEAWSTEVGYGSWDGAAKPSSAPAIRPVSAVSCLTGVRE